MSGQEAQRHGIFTGMTLADGASARLERQALRDDVYDRLLEMLLEHRLRPGASLSIDGLARELGVSPTPVREALVFLEHTGLVTRSARKGYRVATRLSSVQMADLFDARLVVELAAIERTAHAPEGFLPQLRAAHQAHRQAAEDMFATPGPDGLPTAQATRMYFEADWAFHLVLIHAAGNGFLTQMLRGLAAHLHRMLQSAGRGVSDCSAALGEHAAVLAALESGDPGQAHQALRDHLCQVKQRALADAEGQQPSA